MERNLIYVQPLHHFVKYVLQNTILDFIGCLSSPYLLKIQRCWAVSTRSKFPWIFQRLADVNSSCKAVIKRRFSAQENSKASTHHPAEEKDVSCLGFSTMVSARTLLLAVTCSCAYLWLARAEDSSLETRSLDFPLKTQQEKELVRDVWVSWVWNMSVFTILVYNICIVVESVSCIHFIFYTVAQYRFKKKCTPSKSPPNIDTLRL